MVNSTPELKNRAIELFQRAKIDKQARAALVFRLMTENGLSASDLSSLFNITVTTVYDDIHKIEDFDVEFNKTSGGAHHCIMTFDEETAFLAEYEDKALSGLIITMPEIHAEYNKRVGKNTPKSTFYRLLNRHGWRKVLPDRQHPKSDPEIQEEFKKKHSKWNWLKPKN
jgi:transposase